jgi:anaerobic magnesium-protoporphyrin IX monomethyl ester cyclase
VGILLLSGRGPEYKNRAYLDGSLFDPQWDRTRAPGRPLGELSLTLLRYQDAAGTWHPLMRTKTGTIPYLVTYVLESILYSLGEDYESFHLDHVWTGDAEPSTTDPEVVLLSTTFICNRPNLAKAIGWIADRYPGVPLILGGQYSNLKYATILRDHPQASFVIRGDGETALPALLHALRTGGRPEQVPNLVWRDRTTGKLRINALDYIDLDTYPAPAFPGNQAVLPYESMRGCPFSCRFCSYPAASPQWRHKSADKILADWMGYAERNNVRHIQAMDSTFTVPKPRLLQLLPRLSTAPFTWEAYTRANAIHSAELVAALEAAHCHRLSIGFESMSPATLSYMHKQVRTEHNRRAHDLLAASDIRYRVSYMVGYPGETPDDFALTAQYMREEYTGHFMLSVFSFLDETMPVWQDAQRFGLTIATPDDPDYSWSHNGMDAADAHALHRRTLDATRWGSDEAVLLLWQADYETPLIHGADRRTALRLEKAIERLAMLPVDFADQPDEQIRRARTLLATLARDGVQPCDAQGQPIDVLELLTQT